MKVEQINHQNFNDGNQLIEANGGKYYAESVSDLKNLHSLASMGRRMFLFNNFLPRLGEAISLRD
jgi:hypothetical protein